MCGVKSLTTSLSDTFDCNKQYFFHQPPTSFLFLKPCLQWSNTDLSCHYSKMSKAPRNSPWPLPIACNILLQTANIWKLPLAPLLISSYLILALWRTLKFVSLFIIQRSLVCVCGHISTCYTPSLKGNWKTPLYLSHHLQAFTCFPLPLPHLTPFSRGPHSPVVSRCHTW